jgi:uncharacterized membrane protein YozB (DUF420 family)
MVTSSSLVYWSLAGLIFCCMAASGLRGWQLARRGQLAEHGRQMRLAIRLVGVFLATYVVKVLVLGREDLDTWPRAAVITLRVHESFVLLMLVAGAAAWRISRRLEPGEAGNLAWLHRLCGRTALVAALAALLTASMVLFAMYRADPALAPPS